MVSSFISRLVILVFGTLYPAYASYKAVRTKNVKEYVKWMMYWIVFALFTCAETFTDLFLSFWFPFYYELKIITVIYLLSPATKGSSLLYRKFVHPVLIQREQEIDEYIAKAKEQGYHTVLSLGSKGVSYATSLIMHTAIKGLPNLPIAPSSEFLPHSNSEANLLLESDSSIAIKKELKETVKKSVNVKELYQKQKMSADTVWVKQDTNYEDDTNILFGLQELPSCSLKSTSDLESDYKSRKRSTSRKVQKRSNQA